MGIDERHSQIKGFLEQSASAREKFGLIFDGEPASDMEEPFSTSDLRDLALLQNIFYPTKFTSHRRIWGRVIVRCKELVVKVLDPYLRRRLTRQYEINQFTWNIALHIRKQNDQIAALKMRIEKLEARSSK
jgi:hypothetical protein